MHEAKAGIRLARHSYENQAVEKQQTR